jgi:ABC-type histidine transport system ATPase subunit
LALAETGTARAATTAALVAEDIHKSFGELEVLKGVSLTAHEGDVIAMLGSSGSGKSTFLRCMNLLEQPSAGRITVAGETLRLKPARNGGGLVAEDEAQIRRIRARLAMVFQSFNLWSHMTVLQNVVEAPIHVLKRPKAEAFDYAGPAAEGRPATTAAIIIRRISPAASSSASRSPARWRWTRR